VSASRRPRRVRTTRRGRTALCPSPGPSAHRRSSGRGRPWPDP